MIALSWAKSLKTNHSPLLMAPLLALVTACRIKLRPVYQNGREGLFQDRSSRQSKKFGGKFWRGFMGETGGYMWLWFSWRRFETFLDTLTDHTVDRHIWFATPLS